MNDMTLLNTLGLLALGFSARTLFNRGLSWYRHRRPTQRPEATPEMPLWLELLETPLSSKDIGDALEKMNDLPHFHMLPNVSFLDYRTGAHVSWQSYPYLDETYPHLVIQYGGQPPRILADARELQHYIDYQVKVAQRLNPPSGVVRVQRRPLYPQHPQESLI